MSTTIKLTDEQLTSILEEDTALKYQLFNDTSGVSSVDENSTFPDRLKFYMDKKGVTSQDVVTFFKSQYPFLAKSTSSIQHYINGVRTPRLSAVFALADFLEIAPALLLPAKPGKYIEYKGDHVEMITPIPVDLEPEEVTENIPGTLEALDSVVIEEENNNVVVSETDIDDTAPEEGTTTPEAPLIAESFEDDDIVIEDEDYMEGDPQVYNNPLGAGFAQKDIKENTNEIIPSTSLEIEEDDFEDSSSSDDVKDADDFLRELFSDSSSTPYDEYTDSK